MINRVILMGRITNELELRKTSNGFSVLTFTVAVQRNYAKQNEDHQTDFINCVAWRQQADFIGKYFAKGRMIAIEGQLRTRTYDDKKGTRHYVTEVFVDNTSFTGEPKPQGQDGHQSRPPQNELPPPDDPLNTGNFEEYDLISDGGVPF
ncbi:single-stranded DNA-binding protein [Ruminococcus sp. Marseille-P6503]|uniref:single-stranded DNA-binding protein n=1 Tax=Ruminococcus sp. Marseille-P6503 TaxID=2364796 RepID=UPI000F53C1BC|nr:single-stranded DNA-binding protein [Ruminococcus sp. Marseille-P6503]